MKENFSLEIDFLPVGNESKSGDAIAIRFGLYEHGVWQNPQIFIIDGGNSESGAALVEHVRNVYKSKVVNRVILTHPDGDHASGLRNVIEELHVGKIWMHRPWNHVSELKNSLVDGRITSSSLSETLKKSYQYAYDIEQLALKKHIPIFSAHQGSGFSLNGERIITVLGPGREFYKSLIQGSGKTPNMGVFESTKSQESSQKKKVFEDMTFETEHLNDSDGSTSAENDMSLILLLSVAGKKILFTGDAGTQALFKAIIYATENKISLMDLNLFDVPHHGSRHNLSKGILKYIKSEHSVISCAKLGQPRHPSSVVTNSLNRRNMKPVWTQGKHIYYHIGNVPTRETNYIPVTAIPFENIVEIPA